MRTPTTLLVAVGLAALAGCTVKNTEAPALAGPSTLATAISILAQPDSIIQDGSRSTVTATATGPDGRPIANLDLRAEIFVGDTAVDFGSLVPKTLKTGSDGKGVFTYTAPARPAESVGTGTRVTIAITPVGSDFRGEVRRSVDINVVPPGVILPPNGAPVPAFVVTPSPANTRVALNFDASGTTDEGVACGSRCTYAWNFGDGTTGSGQITTHEYRTAGTFTVALTVTDERGTTATITQALAVTATAPPTASFTVSPTPVGLNQDAFFNASASRAAEGRRIVSYAWNFGNSRTATGVTVSHNYSTLGTYQVTLVVTDDSDAVGQATQAITVQANGPVASLTFLPASPRVGQAVFFNASASTTTGASITSYTFLYGDNNTPEVSSVPQQSHIYASAGTYVATVRVTDSLGRVGSTSVTVTVVP